MPAEINNGHRSPGAALYNSRSIVLYVSVLSLVAGSVLENSFQPTNS